MLWKLQQKKARVPSLQSIQVSSKEKSLTKAPLTFDQRKKYKHDAVQEMGTISD